MSRFNSSVLMVLIMSYFCLIQINMVYRNSLPKIMLPEKAHHMIGEIPIIEHFDDGYYSPRYADEGNHDFYEGYPMFTGSTIYYGGGHDQ